MHVPRRGYLGNLPTFSSVLLQNLNCFKKKYRPTKIITILKIEEKFKTSHSGEKVYFLQRSIVRLLSNFSTETGKARKRWWNFKLWSSGKIMFHLEFYTEPEFPSGMKILRGIFIEKVREFITNRNILREMKY